MVAVGQTQMLRCKLAHVSQVFFAKAGLAARSRKNEMT